MTAKLDPDHQVAVWAVRYCLGRMTHVVGSWRASWRGAPYVVKR